MAQSMGRLLKHKMERRIKVKPFDSPPLPPPLRHYHCTGKEGRRQNASRTSSAPWEAARSTRNAAIVRTVFAMANWPTGDVLACCNDKNNKPGLFLKKKKKKRKRKTRKEMVMTLKKEEEEKGLLFFLFVHCLING
jgi:hypothetical protein